MKEAVHCKTQEEWDYVIDKSNHKVNKSAWVNHHDRSALNLSNLATHSFVGFYKENDFTVLSFEEWCSKYGHAGLNKSVEWKAGDLFEVTEDNADGSGFKTNTIYAVSYLSGDGVLAEGNMSILWYVSSMYMKKPSTTQKSNSTSQDFPEGTLVTFEYDSDSWIGYIARKDDDVFPGTYLIELATPGVGWSRNYEVHTNYISKGNNKYLYIIKDNVTTQNKLTKDELLEEAKRRYPQGAKIKSAYSRMEFEVQNHSLIYVNDSGYVDNGSEGYLYYDGKWAEIVEDSKPAFENLTGRYLKALVDSPQCTGYKKGTYAYIESHNTPDSVLIRGGYGASINLIGIDWELMPIGFDPDAAIKEKEEDPFWIPEVGDYLYVLAPQFCGDILKITKVNPDHYGERTKWVYHENKSFSGGGFRYKVNPFDSALNGYALNVDFRKATAQEIAEYEFRKGLTEQKTSILTSNTSGTTITNTNEKDDLIIKHKEPILLKNNKPKKHKLLII